MRRASTDSKCGFISEVAWVGLAILAMIILMTPACAKAQLAGTGTIEGTVTDPSGAVISGAQVSALNLSTGAQTTRVTTDRGTYSLAPLDPATYRITVTAAGFEALVRNNVSLNGLQVIGLDLTLKVGSASQTVTVSTAPPPLETTNATVGNAIDDHAYTNIPLEMGNLGSADQRRATDVAYLVAGVSAQLTNNNATDAAFVVNGNVGSTQMHIDGLPLALPAGNGDPRYVWTAIPAESINQFQVQTGGYSAEYSGLGLENFSVKSGTNQIHGTFYTIVRNTAFDASGFIPVKNSVTGALIKTPEHQWEDGMNIGGPIWKDKLFLFGSYMDYRDSTVTLPNFETIPTPAELCGDFSASDAGGKYPIYDPTTQTASTSAPTRTQFSAIPYIMKNGTCVQNGTTAVANVIPQNEISPQTQYLQKYWSGVTYSDGTSTNSPTNTTPSLNNFVGSYPNGLANWSTANRLDWVINSKQSMNVLAAFGRQSTVNGSAETTNDGPAPYRADKAYDPRTAVFILSHIWQITPSLVNQGSIGLAEYHSNTYNLDLYTSAFSSASAGITNLAAGQASASFPTISWSGNDSLNQWGGGGTFSSTNNNTTSYKDNVQWVHGKHSLTFGTMGQLFGYHNIPAWGNSTPYAVTFSATPTAQFSSKTTINSSTGLAYASYLLGAANSGTMYTAYGAGYLETYSYAHQFGFYVNDDYRITPKLTANLGLRWDLVTPFFQEKNSHYSFLNPTVTNPVTGTPGILQFAGANSSATANTFCNCTTPAQMYYKNLGPRLGLAYELNNKTVIRASFGIFYSTGSGGFGSSGVSTGNAQDGTTFPAASASAALSQPAYYLNNGAYFKAGTPYGNTANTAAGGASFTATTPPLINQTFGTYYSTAALAPYASSQTLGYIDPRLGNRSPQYPEWSIGFQRLLTNNITATVNYVGNEAHFLYDGASRGYYQNQLNPIYLGLQGLAGDVPSSTVTAGAVSASCTQTTALAQAQCLYPSIVAPYASFPLSATTIPGTTSTITPSVGQMIKPFPQFNGVSDLMALDSNSNYHALQISIQGRQSHGLSFNVSYTRSKTLDDNGTFRSGYAIPAGYLANEPTKSWPVHRADYSLSVIDLPQDLTSYVSYDLPFGKGHIGGTNFIVRNIVGGWTLSGVYTYVSGLPLVLTQSSSCTASAGTCMPSYNTQFNGSIMPNGKWGAGATAATLGSTQYINPNGFIQTTSSATIPGTTTNAFASQNGGYLIGDLRRTAPYGLRGPANYDIDSTIKRSFDIWKEGRVKFVFEASAFNTTNRVWFGSPGTDDAASGGTITETVGSSSFGTVTKQANNPRQFQFAGHFNF
jgi:hypothetical protein